MLLYFLFILSKYVDVINATSIFMAGVKTIFFKIRYVSTIIGRRENHAYREILSKRSFLKPF